MKTVLTCDTLNGLLPLVEEVPTVEFGDSCPLTEPVSQLQLDLQFISQVRDRLEALEVLRGGSTSVFTDLL